MNCIVAQSIDENGIKYKSRTRGIRAEGCYGHVVPQSTARPVRVGVQLPQYDADYGAIRAAVQACEELGVDIVFNWDHFFGPGKNSEAKHFESWAMLGAWAESTSRIEFGPLVSCSGYRNPDLTADMARTLDHISGGRFVLGLGAGFKERDYDEYGYNFGTPGSRIADFADALQRIKKRTAQLNPAPLRHIPLIIGGGGEQKTLKLVAQYADIWHTFAEGEEFARKDHVLREYCAATGRNDGEIERSVLVAGQPEHVATPLRAMGVTLFVLAIHGPLFNLEPIQEWLEWRDDQNG